MLLGNKFIIFCVFFLFSSSAFAAGQNICQAVSDPVAKTYPASAFSELEKDGTGAIIGDSIAARWSSKDLLPLLGSDIVNLGVAQDEPGNVLWRLSHITTPRHWHRALIIVGVNSSWKSHQCDVAGGVEAVVEKVRHIAPEAQIIVLSVLPHAPGLRKSLPLVDPINERLSLDSQRVQFTFIDPNKSFLAVCEDKQSCPLLENWIHPTEAGYSIIMSTIERKVPGQ